MISLKTKKVIDIQYQSMPVSTKFNVNAVPLACSIYDRVLLKKPEENKVAIEEIYLALRKTSGYFYNDVKEALIENFLYSFE